MKKEYEKDDKSLDVSDAVQPASEEVVSVEEEAAESELELDVESAEETEVVETVEEVKENTEEGTEKQEVTVEDDSVVEIELSEEDAEESEPELSLESAEDTEPELDLEAAEPVEIELSDEEKEEKRQKRNKLLKKIGLITGGILLAVYLGFAIFFSGHFYFNTWINGRNYSMNSIEQVDGHFERFVSEYKLWLKKSDGVSEVISGDEISLTYVKGEGLTQLLKSQNPFLWPVSLFKEHKLETLVGVSYDEAKLSAKIASLNLMKEENQVPPISAHPEFNGTEFAVKEEFIGSTIDPDLFNAEVRESLDNFESDLDMVEELCYVLPPFLKDSPEVAAACDTMNAYLGAEVTYVFGSQKEVVNSEKIASWLVTDENMQVAFQKEQVAAYIKSLADKYDTYKKERTFTGGNGNTVKVTGGSYGWLIDQEAEYAALCANIENKEKVEKEPVYKKKAATHDGPDWGGSYVEVDLSNQKVYLFKDGKLVDSASCVTGCVAQGHSTPQGVYSISYCQRGATLRGPKQPDGSYEWESPVRYWMPFNGGIGLHDADWRGSFGGTIYKYNGSHGCVNLPIPFAKTVFGNVSAGTPVICHY